MKYGENKKVDKLVSKICDLVVPIYSDKRHMDAIERDKFYQELRDAIEKFMDKGL